MKKIFSTLILVLFCTALFAQNLLEPRLDIAVRKTLDYERPPRLLEEDRNRGITFKFEPGLEIITDINAVKVYLFDKESGRTPFEKNNIKSGYIRVKLEKPGYEDYSFWVNVKDNYRTTVQVFYKDKDAVDQNAVQPPRERKSSFLYTEINPQDPQYYRQLYFMNNSDYENFETASIYKDFDTTILALTPSPVEGGHVFIWDGRDAQGDSVPDGEYGVRLSLTQEYKLRVSRAYSRQALSYFSGFAGLSLVPSARMFFRKGFQFGSTFGVDSLHNSHDYNLPFSFFIRLSPLKRWEMGLEGETAFITETGRSSLRINSSQKVYLFNIHSLQVSMGVRGSYKSAINDFSESVGGNIIRDPSGASFFLPMQYAIKNWDFFGSPEILYTLRPLSTNIQTDKYDITAAVRWGVMFSSGSIFTAGLSSALYFPSYRGNPASMQAAAEGTIYVPRTPLYMIFYGILQKVRGYGDGTIVGMNLGFVL